MAPTPAAPAPTLLLLALVLSACGDPVGADVPDACMPHTCAALSAVCGEHPDGCGGVLTCGPCAEGEVCTPEGVCRAACPPLSCDGRQCGAVEDGCGGRLTCGTCADGLTCTQAGTCESGCVPARCGERSCGRFEDGCGATVDCGDCADGLVCTADGRCDLPACPATDVRSGHATWYAADGSGACGYPVGTAMPLVAAANDADYADSALCGACAEVTGPLGTAVVRIVDLCPGCTAGGLDLSPQAFDLIAERADGRVPIHWRVVPCDVPGPVRFAFDGSSTQWWVALQVRDHRHPVARLELLDEGGSWQPLTRSRWNWFSRSSPGAGPLTLRLTDLHGQQLVETVPLSPGAVVDGAGQLPACRP